MRTGTHVVVAGGGTAGHIEPAMNLADALRRRDPAVGITALGTETGMENTLVPARGYTLRHVPRVPLPRRPTLDLFRLPSRLRGAVKAAGAVLDDVGADVVVGFGGYVSVPAYLAARKRKLPIVVHEANARAGVANRLGARMTRFVAVTARAEDLPHGRLIGLPLRRTISTLDRAATRDEARKHFGLDPDRPTLLVFGGSLGAKRLNDAATGAADALRAAGIQVLHSVGPGARGLDHRRAASRRGALRRGAVPGADGPGLRGRRRGAVPGRRDDLRGAGGGRPAGGLRAAADRQRRTTAQRAARRRGRRGSGGGRFRCGRGLDHRERRPAGRRPRPGERDGCGRGRARAPGRRRGAGRPGARSAGQRFRQHERDGGAT